MNEEIRDFGDDTAIRKQLQPPAARRHPGKLHLLFLRDLADRYVQPGAQVLDPMAGSGSLLYLTLPPWGCHCTLVELEARWASAAAATWSHLQRSLVAPTGTATIYCGDARVLLAEGGGPVDNIILSPPYGDALGPGRVGPALQAWIADQSPARQAGSFLNGTNYDGGNGLLRVEPTYDAILTSPPYADMLSRPTAGPRLQRHLAEDPRCGRSTLITQSAYDAIVTSPPYADSLSIQRHEHDFHAERMGGNAHGANGATRMDLARRGYDPGIRSRKQANPAQIGNLSGKRYQAAMAELYATCVPLLRPGGVMIVIIKNIVRKHKEVDLLGAARQQLEALGLVYEITHYRSVRLGPFHAIRKKKDPDALIITREGALVLRKPEVSL